MSDLDTEHHKHRTNLGSYHKCFSARAWSGITCVGSILLSYVSTCSTSVSILSRYYHPYIPRNATTWTKHQHAPESSAQALAYVVLAFTIAYFNTSQPLQGRLMFAGSVSDSHYLDRPSTNLTRYNGTHRKTMVRLQRQTIHCPSYSVRSRKIINHSRSFQGDLQISMPLSLLVAHDSRCDVPYGPFGRSSPPSKTTYFACLRIGLT